jgi:hypothetical protein
MRIHAQIGFVSEYASQGFVGAVTGRVKTTLPATTRGGKQGRRYIKALYGLSPVGTDDVGGGKSDGGRSDLEAPTPNTAAHALGGRMIF